MIKDTENINLLVDHLFRHESGKMISVLTKVLGTGNIALSEDMVQEAMLEAINQWEYKGVPDNPAGWLYNVAKYKAVNFIKREKTKQKYSSELLNLLQPEFSEGPTDIHLFSEQEVADDQLRMMFTCCHPSISTDSQIALTLKTLCGFSIPEIANAFLTNGENINKRLVRARQIIRENKVDFEVPFGNDFSNRLNAVLETIYLLFNEGYNSSSGNDIIRFELCEEAIHLAQLIAGNSKITVKSDVYALLSLMLLNASRFKARVNEQGEITDMAKQNRNLWNKDFIRKGIEYLDKSVESNRISKYQVLAAISAHHCTASGDETTDWENILALYQNLSQIDNSPIVLLNKAVAVSKVLGVEKATDDLLALSGDSLLNNYPHYYSTIAELYLQQKKNARAAHFFQKAISFSNNKKEIDYLADKLSSCKQSS